MKVVHVCNAPLVPDHPDYGRVEIHPGRWALNLARAQRKYFQLDARLVVQVPGSSRDHETSLDTVPVHYISAPDRFRSATLFILDVRRLSKRTRLLKPDLVHAHGTEDAYSLAAQQTGLPNIITAQGLHFLINRKVKPAPISREKAVQFTEWLAFKRARHVIAKSAYVAQELKARFPHLTLHLIPNTFDERLLTVQEQKRPNSLVFVGTISPWKGVHTLREALLEVSRQIPGVTLDIAGDSPNTPLPYEIEQKRLLLDVLGDRVTFHGRLEQMELARLVASSMALVAPSLEDMFGNQLIEAFVVGTYGIVTEGTAMAENVQRFGGGTVVPPENANRLAQAIITALTNPPHVPMAAIRKQIREQMGPEVIARRHYDLYLELLKR
jgi:glycosyltransferase involved in cell wall biosynthesis